MIESFFVVAGQVVTLFLLIGVGYVLARLGLLRPDGASQMSTLALYVVTPCIMIRSFETVRTPEMLGTLGRFFLAYTVCTVLGVLLAQPLQMLGYGLFTPTSVYYVNDSVPPEDQVKGQALMMVASNGLGGVLGSFFAGQTLERGGPDGMLLFCVLSCAAGVLVGAASLRLARRT